MTHTISQPCLEFTELCLTSVVTVSACLKFCCQQKHVSAQVPPWMKETPLRACDLPGQPVLPGFSPFHSACSPLGCGYTQPIDF